MRKLLVLALVLPLVVSVLSAQTPRPDQGARQSAAPLPHDVAKDLPERLARWKKVDMPFRSEGLSAREIQLVNKLVEACNDIEDIFWRQTDPTALQLYKGLAEARNTRDQMLRRLLFINGSRFDLLDDNRPFVGTEPMPPGAALHPPGLTREQIETYVAAHPKKKPEIYSPYTVVQRRGPELIGIPYHVEYAEFLKDAAAKLREAAELSDDPDFAKFLRMRADALLTDDYFASDLAWLSLKKPKFDIIYAPYETYTDELLGVKTSYGAAVLIRNQPESQKLELYEKYVAEIQEALPLPRRDLPSKRGLATPMEVMDSPFRAGDLNHGYQAVADNLPNDPRIHERKGSKKIFFKNFMDARVENIILPVARLVMQPEQAAKVSADGYMASTILHEISHGLGPAFARVRGRKVDIREAIGPAYSGLEEAKADVVGMFGLKWLVDHGVLSKDRLDEYYVSYVADHFRTARMGVGEAHGRAEIMEFNYLSEQKAIIRDPKTGRYALDFQRMPATIASLAKELLEMEATGDRARTEKWFKKYDVVPPELISTLAMASEVPVDIEPIFSFPQPVR